MIVYLITNNVNGKQYIGQTTRPIEERWKSHLFDANTHRPWLISKAIRKYGPDKFLIEPLAEVNTKTELDFCEVLFIQLMGTLAPRGYNVSHGGDGRAVCHSPETCKKISASKKGWNPSAETRHKMALAKIGKPAQWDNREQCRNLGLANRGRIRSAEWIKHQSEAHRGKSNGPLSPATRAKISAAHIAYHQRKRQGIEQAASPEAVTGMPGGPGFGSAA